MSTTTGLIQGFAKTVKAIRQREGLTQKEMAEGMGIGLTLLKRYEQENLEAIGPNGFSISIFAKLSDFSNISPKRLFEEIIINSPGISKNDEKAKGFSDSLYSLSEDDLNSILSLSQKESKPFGNHLQWILKMSAHLARLDEKKRAKVGIQILQETMDLNQVTEGDLVSQLQELFGFTLQS